MNSLAQLESIGYEFDTDGKDISFSFNSGIIENENKINQLLQDIKRNKPKVIEILSARNKKRNRKIAISKGYLPYEPGDLYEKQITKNSFIFIQKIDGQDKWTSYRMTYEDGQAKARTDRGIETNNFIEVIKRTEKYIENYLNFIK